MYVVAVDIGYSNLKVLTGEHTSEPTVAILPAGAGPLSAMPSGIGLRQDEQHFVVTVDGEQWAAGVEPGRLQNCERELHPNYASTKAYRALCYAALARAGRQQIDCLVTGLPVAHYQDPARREELRAMLVGEHQITANRRVVVKSVDILPQPVGAYLDTIEHATGIEDFEQARTLVLDPGFFSVDWVLLDNGEMRSANSGSSANAMSMLFDVADDLVHQDHAGRLGRDQIERAVRGGVKQLQLFGQRIELEPYLIKAAKRTAATALTALKQSIRGERREVDFVLLAGGGATVYTEAAREAFPRARVMVPKAPVLANARGFWAYASGV